jgi:hypothetical protein
LALALRPKGGGVQAMATKPAPLLLNCLTRTRLMKTWPIKRFGLS